MWKFWCFCSWQCASCCRLQYGRHLGSGKAEAELHWGRGKMATISQMTFSHAFSWMKMYELWLTFHKLCSYGIFQHLFRYLLGADQAKSHYLNQWCLVYWRIYAPLGLNELTPWGLSKMVVARYIQMNSLKWIVLFVRVQLKLRHYWFR